jgi:hypothetical protein
MITQTIKYGGINDTWPINAMFEKINTYNFVST